MKSFLTSLPWLALLGVAIISVPRAAHTAPPPPQEFPHLHAALGELREAKHELESARHDFCGHRRDAVEQTDRAIREIQRAVDCRR